MYKPPMLAGPSQASAASAPDADIMLRRPCHFLSSTVARAVMKGNMVEATGTLSEWLRRWTRNPLGSARKGLNLLGVALPWLSLPSAKACRAAWLQGRRGCSTEEPPDWTATWLACSWTELLLDSLTELLLHWTFRWLNCSLTELLFGWTAPWLSCYLIGLFLEWTVPWLHCHLTEAILDWTVPWLNWTVPRLNCYFSGLFAFFNLRNSEVSQVNFLWLQYTYMLNNTWQIKILKPPQKIVNSDFSPTPPPHVFHLHFCPKFPPQRTLPWDVQTQCSRKAWRMTPRCKAIMIPRPGLFTYMKLIEQKNIFQQKRLGNYIVFFWVSTWFCFVLQDSWCVCVCKYIYIHINWNTVYIYKDRWT